MMPWITNGERCADYVLVEVKRWLLAQGEYDVSKRKVLNRIAECEVAWSDLVNGRTPVVKEEPKAEEKKGETE